MNNKAVYLIILLLFVCLLPNRIFSQKSESSIWYVEGYNEQKARNYLDNNYLLDQIEGIWQSTDGFKYAIIKDVKDGKSISDQFRAIILETSHNGWRPTQIKAFINFGTVDGIYSMKYYTRNIYGNDTETQNLLLFVKSPVILTFTRLDGVEISLYKLYPNQGEERSSESQAGSISKPAVAQWSGSAVAIAKYYLATNYHVVEDASSLVVTGVNGNLRKDYMIEVVATDKTNDLAICKVIDNDFDGFGVIRYGFNTETVDVGTEIFVLGYPMTNYMGEELKLTTGVISSKSGYKGDVSIYQISAPVQPGNSGGPLFSNNGDLIGIVNAKLTGAENVGYAIKLSYLRNLIESCNEKIDYNNTNQLFGTSLAEKVKDITPFVLMVKANTISYGGNPTGQSNPTGGTNREMAKKHLQLSTQKYQNEDYEGAFFDACESVRYYPMDENQYLRGYLALVFIENYDMAIESFQYCIGNNYRLNESRQLLGNCYYRQKKYDDAIKQYDKVIESDRKNIESLYYRAQCKSEMENHWGAIQDYKQAIKYENIVDNKNIYSTIYNNLAWEYRLLGKFNEAKPFIDEALNRNHMKDYIWETHGEIAYHLNDYTTCLSSMNNAITIYKDNTEVSSGFYDAYYYRGLAKRQLGNLSGALSDFNKAKELATSISDSSFIKKVDSVLVLPNDNYTFSPTTFQERIINNPIVTKTNENNTRITAIELTEEFTAIYLSITNNEYVSGGWYSINADCELLDNNTKTKSHLLKAENCAISPKKTDIKMGETKNFVLYFPTISSICKSVDLIEGDNSTWNFYGIKFKSDSTKPNSTKPNLKNNKKKISIDGVIITTDLSDAEGWYYLCDVTKRGVTSGEIGYNQAIKGLKETAAEKGCGLIVVTNIYEAFSGIKVTAKLFKR